MINKFEQDVENDCCFINTKLTFVFIAQGFSGQSLSLPEVPSFPWHLRLHKIRYHHRPSSLHFNKEKLLK
jgi:hypothetical protein